MNFNCVLRCRSKRYGRREHRKWRGRGRAAATQAKSPGQRPARGETPIELVEPCGCGGAVSLHKGLERRVELRAQAEFWRKATKLEDLPPNRQRGHELCPLQRLRRVRQCRQTAVHAAFPILSRRRGGVR